jgi:hypothetical protein
VPFKGVSRVWSSPLRLGGRGGRIKLQMGTGLSRAVPKLVSCETRQESTHFETLRSGRCSRCNSVQTLGHSMASLAATLWAKPGPHVPLMGASDIR